MTHKLAYALVAGSFLLGLGFVAAEPTNLAQKKQELIRYHDSGAYNREISNVIAQSMRYLQLQLSHKNKSGKKPAIVLDIDETALSNYPNMVSLGFGGTLEQIREDENQGVDPVIAPTLKLYRFAKEHHVAVFFVTGRQEVERDATEKNLQQAGYYNWDGLYLRTAQFAKSPAMNYKTAIRKQIIAKGYDILLNIGDQKSDLAGGYARKGFKIPNPYYFIA